MRYFADYIKGKPYQKTVLWENSSPTSAFAGQTVTLSDDITNYDQLEFVYKDNTTDTATRIAILDVNNIKNFTYNGFYSYMGSYSVVRYIEILSNTSLLISTSYRVNNSGNSTSYCIPLKIIGIKKGLGENST